MSVKENVTKLQKSTAFRFAVYREYRRINPISYLDFVWIVTHMRKNSYSDDTMRLVFKLHPNIEPINLNEDHRDVWRDLD